MNDQDLLRYARHILLPEIDIGGQQILLSSTVLLVGIGGLGSPSAMYLAASGIGHLIIADFDQVELSNLQRQIAHRTDDLGKDKVNSAKATILAINPNVKVTTLKDLNREDLQYWIHQADLVLDGTDNFTSRFQINAACVQERTPLVSAAVIRFEGQLSVFKGYEANQPCYQCLYPKTSHHDENCVQSGVMAPVAGVLGCLQALQSIKVLLDIGEQLIGQLLLIDALDLSMRNVKIRPDSHCPICSSP